MTGPMVSDGTCAEGRCRVMPDAFCRDCQRWYCSGHKEHGRTHALDTVRIPAPSRRYRRPSPR